MEPALAVTPNTDEAFLREVDEELRRDQVAGLWKRWGRWMIVAVVVALAAFGGYLLWQNHRQNTVGEQGEKLQGVIQDLSAGKTAAQVAAPLADLAASKTPGYRAVAGFAQADALFEKGDTNGAAAKLGEIAGDNSLGQPFRDLALVRQTTIQFDTLKPQVVIDRLTPLAVKGNAWFGSAGELVAAAYLRMNRRDLADRLYGQIGQDDDVPDSIRQRAVQMASVLDAEASTQGGEKKAQ